MSDFKPKVIGKYYLAEPVGIGGMGEVYRGKLLGAGQFAKEVAIKKISREVTADKEMRAMFEMEASICSRLNHPNIISVFDFFFSEEGLLMAMEFVQGQNLRQILDRNRKNKNLMSVESVLYIASQVASGLEYAHTRTDANGENLNLVHRDISPQNIMVSYDGTVKIVDFGLARTRSRTQFTRTGTIKGKLSYMSPEQAEGKELRATSDLFSLGITLFELLTTKRVFSGENEAATLRKVLDCQIPTASSLNPSLPQEIDSWLSKCLARDPRDRFQSASEFGATVQTLMEVLGCKYDGKQLSAEMESLFGDEKKRDSERSQEILDLVILEKQRLNEIDSNLALDKTQKVKVEKYQNSKLGLEVYMLGTAILGIALMLFVSLRSKQDPPAPQIAQQPVPVRQTDTGQIITQSSEEIQAEEAFKKRFREAVASWEEPTDQSKRVELLNSSDAWKVVQDTKTHFENGVWSKVKKLGNNIARGEVTAILEVDPTLFKNILSQPKKYPEWINQPIPGFTTYGDLMSDPQAKSGLKANIVGFDALKSYRDIEVSYEEQTNYQRVYLELGPSGDSLVRKLYGQAIFFKNPQDPKSVYLYGEWLTHVSNGIVYGFIREDEMRIDWQKSLYRSLISKYYLREGKGRSLASEPPSTQK